jgi:hypothetical protein
MQNEEACLAGASNAFSGQMDLVSTNSAVSTRRRIATC